MKNMAIQKAIDIAGGQKKLADLCGVSQPTVWRWLHGGGVDVRFVMLIVKATKNRLSPSDIKPELQELLSSIPNSRKPSIKDTSAI